MNGPYEVRGPVRANRAAVYFDSPRVIVVTAFGHATALTMTGEPQHDAVGRFSVETEAGTLRWTPRGCSCGGWNLGKQTMETVRGWVS
jgi:hypothetical protein